MKYIMINTLGKWLKILNEKASQWMKSRNQDAEREYTRIKGQGAVSLGKPWQMDQASHWSGRWGSWGEWVNVVGSRIQDATRKWNTEHSVK